MPPAIETILFEGQPYTDLDSLWNALYRSYNTAENCPIDYRFLNEIPQCNNIEWSLFTAQEFRDAIAKYFSLFSPGPDYVSWRHIKPIIADDKCLRKFIQIANAYIILDIRMQPQ